MSETSHGPRNIGVINYDYRTPEKNNYTARPPNFSGDSTKFKWWKSKMCTHIIGIADEVWDILEDGIDIPVNGVGMVSDRKVSHLLKRRLIGNITELEEFWYMLYLTLSTSKF